MHTVVECISTLISEDDTYFFTDFKRKFQKKNVLTEKNSVWHCINKAKASLSFHLYIMPQNDLVS